MRIFGIILSALLTICGLASTYVFLASLGPGQQTRGDQLMLAAFSFITAYLYYKEDEHDNQ